MAKRRSGRGSQYQWRKPRNLSTKPRILIVCEGEKTEPNYFRKFRVPPNVVEVFGLGVDPRQLVDEAERLQMEDRNGGFQQVWCVFDRDSWPADNFTGAIFSAQSKGFRVAYSNQAFELWYLLHFHYYDTGIPRAEYISRLHGLLGKTYVKNSTTIYDDLFPHMETAIRNAERLLTQYNPPDPAADNPSTTVHELVAELRKYSR